MRTLVLSLLSLVVVLAGAMDARGDTTPPPDPNAGAFQALSPGNQKIAQSLYDAQVQPAPGTPPSPTAPKVFSLDEIAAMKQSGQGWGGIFKTMQTQDQLPGAKNLGQIVSGKYQPPAPATVPATPPATPTGGTTPSDTAGAFARLSPGNQKIAQSLYDAQVKPAPGAPPSPTAPKVYSRDEIAAMKQSGRGWGGVFKEMKTQGQLEGSKNLGSVVSGKYSSPTVTTITTASGRTDVVGTRAGSPHAAVQKHGGTGSSGPGATKGAGHGSGSSKVTGVSGGQGGGHGGSHGHVAQAKPAHAGHGKGHAK